MSVSSEKEKEKYLRIDGYGKCVCKQLRTESWAQEIESLELKVRVRVCMGKCLVK